MLFLRRLLVRLFMVMLAGWVIRRLIASDNPRAQKIGHSANRTIGRFIGLDEQGQRKPRRRARLARS